MTDSVINWGILGCASIAKEAVIPSIQQSKIGEVRAIASRDIEKAKKTAEQCGIPAAYGSYEDLLADPSIDAVYIPLPNHLHSEWTIKAMQSGKHVLCEKPFALDTNQAEEMIKASKRTNRVLAEGYMYRHHPRYAMIKEMIEEGKIGGIRGFHGEFCFNNSEDYNNVRYQPDMGGGSILDVGCYPINAIRYLLNQEPEALTVNAFYSPLHGNVDMMASGLLEFSKGVSATFQCSMWADYKNTLHIIGTKGRIEIPFAYSCSEETGNFYFSSKGERKEITVSKVNQYVLQIDHFHDSILQKQPYPISLEDSLNNTHVLQACLKSAKGRCRVELSEITNKSVGGVL
ncbi:Gfo/Idh/MocA family oxidoreductase [Neobacillus sp. MER 74]|uniref:Gfo/Idh/MocA family protein n=1 Tax=Neobacillus sp. MER 74 TaxID=2939566 RepID=UPI00203EAD7C|nr:Gfo/Idh/MocA family oxidoreductase [Neobacillus sp. MER 74]MCM3115366.1 Gfo/Idh/MocA family oxidoreductase [Neobacillus sp. MER 74]